MAGAGAFHPLPPGTKKEEGLNEAKHSQLDLASRARMSFAESKIERERDRALASLAFVEREQERVLHGLHQVGDTENIALFMVFRKSPL